MTSSSRGQRWSSAFELTGSWKGHDGIVLSSVITRLPSTSSSKEGKFALVTGGNDDMIKVSVIDAGYNGCVTFMSCRYGR